MIDLRHPAEPVFQNELDLDEIALTNENLNKGDYHKGYRWNLSTRVCN